MILETIVTTISPDGIPHLAPMGVHRLDDDYVILPFRPSITLSNLSTTRCAVVNATDDVRIFAGSLTGHRDWPLLKADRVDGVRLADALSHTELELTRFDDDPLRPRLVCHAVHQASHQPFAGFNRAQFAVIEASILVSRITMLPIEKIDQELAYLRIGLEKTAGPRELEAWSWLIARIEAWRAETAAASRAVG